jgi:hypothetical protein
MVRFQHKFGVVAHCSVALVVVCLCFAKHGNQTWMAYLVVAMLSL